MIINIVKKKEKKKGIKRNIYCVNKQVIRKEKPKLAQNKIITNNY